jgi:hypothetical protein
MSNLRDFLRANSWPLGIVGVVCCFFIADGTLIYAAVRDKATAPEENYYEKAVKFDEQKARVIEAERVGLSADIMVAEAPLAEMPRRVDLRIRNGSGQPVSGLSGTLTAIRPSDSRLKNAGSLTAVPDDDGLYRMLLKLPMAGLWEFELEANKGPEKYRVVVRKDVKL